MKTMLGLVRDCLLSFCPRSARREFPAESPERMLQAALWSGLAQFFLAGLALAAQFKEYFAHRAQQLAPQISAKGEVFQAGIAVILVLEYLLHPLAFFLLYLSIEGFFRFAAGLVTRDALPSFLVFLAFKAQALAGRSRERRRSEAIPRDTMEKLSDGRIRIAAARAKDNWNQSITIGIGGAWFEVERGERGAPPRDYVYLLRPAPEGKVLRGYQEYDAASAMMAGAVVSPAPGEPGGQVAKKMRRNFLDERYNPD